MNIAVRTLVYVAITALVFGVLLLTRPATPKGPTGIFLPAKSDVSLPPSSAPVTVYNKSVPFNNKVLGTVHVEMHYDTLSQANEQRMIEFAKAMSAKQGGNGLVIKVFGASGDDPSGLAVYVLRGVAVKG